MRRGPGVWAAASVTGLMALVILLGAGFSAQDEAAAAAAGAAVADVAGTGSAEASAGSVPQPYPGGPTGCVLPDPTGTGGCVTGATGWLLRQVAVHGPAVGARPVSCWDAHAWNPASDHPRGRACDYTFGRAGTFPAADDVRAGWALALWLRAHAGPLHVSYVIWQGRIWSRARDGEGWRRYTGGGVYEPTDPVGGHYDHVHASLTD